MDRKRINKRLALTLLLIGAGITLLGLSALEFKSRQEVLRIGDFSASASTTRNIPALRYFGFAAVAAGIFVWFLPWQKR